MANLLYGRCEDGVLKGVWGPPSRVARLAEPRASEWVRACSKVRAHAVAPRLACPVQPDPARARSYGDRRAHYRGSDGRSAAAYVLDHPGRPGGTPAMVARSPCEVRRTERVRRAALLIVDPRSRRRPDPASSDCPRECRGARDTARRRRDR